MTNSSMIGLTLNLTFHLKLSDKLPFGAYCPLNNTDLCGWSLIRNGSRSVVRMVNDILRMELPRELRVFDRLSYVSELFEPLLLYNSIKSSEYYQSCKVSRVLMTFIRTFIAFRLFPITFRYDSSSNKKRKGVLHLKCLSKSMANISATKRRSMAQRLKNPASVAGDES